MLDVKKGDWDVKWLPPNLCHQLFLINSIEVVLSGTHDYDI